jgi:ribose 5-phosphate isomerase B
VLCLGARVIGGALAVDLACAFLAATYAGKERFQRRLDKVLAIERRFTGGAVK